MKRGPASAPAPAPALAPAPARAPAPAPALAGEGVPLEPDEAKSVASDASGGSDDLDEEDDLAPAEGGEGAPASASAGSKRKAKVKAPRVVKRLKGTDGSDLPAGSYNSFSDARGKRLLTRFPWICRDGSAFDKIKNGQLWCTACGHTKIFNAVVLSCQQHEQSKDHKHNKAIADQQPDIVAVAAAAGGPNLHQRQSIMRTLGSALLVAGGIVPHQIDTVLRGDDDRPGVAEIIKSGTRLNSGTTARTVDLPSVVKRIQAELKALLPTVPHVLLCDGGDTTFGGSAGGSGHSGKSGVYNFFAWSAYLEEPTLLRTFMLHDKSLDADALAELWREVMEDYGLTHVSPSDAGTTIGGLCDNTATVVKAMRLAHLAAVLACLSHWLDLMLDAALFNLALVPVLEALNSTFSPAAGITEVATQAGLTPGMLRTASFKFSYAQPALQYLGENYDKVRREGGRD